MSFQNSFSFKSADFAYFKAVESLLNLLTDRVMKFFQKHPVDDKSFSASLIALYSKMSQLEIQKPSPIRFSNAFHDLSVHLSAIYPQSRCTSPDSIPESQPSPVPFEPSIHSAKPYLNYPLILEEIQEESFKTSVKKTTNIRFHSQPRKERDATPIKSFKHTITSNYSRPADDIMSKYMKFSEKFVEKKNKKDESLYFNDGVFFHLP